MTNDLTDLRIASAKALGHRIFMKGDEVWIVIDDSEPYPYDVNAKWAPDLPGHEAQLVECLNFLRHNEGTVIEIFNPNPDFGGANEAIHVQRDYQPGWKRYEGDTLGEAIMRAVGEVK